MANEFIIKNGYFAQGSSNVTGSLSVSQGITGSLFGTSSWAVTASYALSPPYWTVRTVSGSASTASFNEFLLVSASSHTVILPAASENIRVGIKWIVAPTTGSIKTSGSGVTIDGTDRSTTGLFIYNQWDAYTLVSNGTNWFIMA